MPDPSTVTIHTRHFWSCPVCRAVNYETTTYRATVWCKQCNRDYYVANHLSRDTASTAPQPPTPRQGGA